MILLRNKSAQVSIEFLSYVGFVLLVVSTYIILFYFNYGSKSVMEEDVVQLYAENLRRVMEYVYFQGDGFYLNYSLPSTIVGKNYSVNIYETMLVMVVEDQSYVEMMSITNVSGYFVAGRKHVIYNEGGVLHVVPY